MNSLRNHSLARQRGGVIFKLLFLLFFVFLLAMVYLARYPLLRLAGGFWVVNDSPQTSDAIIFIGDDNFNADRATRAAELFKAGWGQHIVASGRYLRPYASVPELMQHDLADRGVPASAVVRFNHRAQDTREEAMAVSEFASAHGWKRILLVTSNYHTRRTKYIFERTLSSGTQLRVIAARDSEYDPTDWWRHRESLKIFFHEFVGYWVTLWEMRHSEVRTS